jgi:hypothetical protein
MKQHKLKPHQIELATRVMTEVNKLNENNLYYLVSKPNENTDNLTIPEIKKYIKSGIQKYTQEFLLHNYYWGAEKKLFQYILFIEYPKDFYLATLDINANLTSLNNDVHFHMFISSNNNFVNMTQLGYQILLDLTSSRKKPNSIKKYKCYKIEDGITKEFAEYHTKQHYQYIDKERLMINI